MSRKHAELEREFIEDLEPRTGRPLADWMSLIDDTGLSERNAIIDWLRPQGLTFAHASWLERIHHNGGRPIYGDAPERLPPSAPQPAASARPAPRPAPSPRAEPIAQPSALPRTVPIPLPREVTATAAPAAVASIPPTSPPTSASVSLADLLGRGKGLRPLAEMIVREIAQALPGLVAAPVGDLVSLQQQSEFGVLLVGPKELRLGLDLGEWPIDAIVTRSRIPGTSARITHMLIINDARQITPALIELVQRASNRVTPGS